MEWTLARLQQLRAEYASGDSQLLELDRRRADVRDSLLRIEGAIRVLEEQVQAEAVVGAVRDPGSVPVESGQSS